LEETIEEADSYNSVLRGEASLEDLNLPKAHSLNPSDYLTSYARTVISPQERIGGLTLERKRYEPGQGFVYDEIKTDSITYRETTPFGYFEKPFEYLSLSKNDRVWMSVTPHEINTMREPLKAMHGRVLLTGLGLGYFAFEALRKADVSQVTVIENDRGVIALFNKCIRPFFPKDKPLRIVEGDAFEKMEEERYDSCFHDIWHFPDDGLELYLKLRRLERPDPSITYRYWIEESILALIRRGLIILADEELHRGEDDDNYLEASTLSDRLINSLHFLLKGVEIKSIGDLRGYLDLKGLKEVAGRLTL